MMILTKHKIILVIFPLIFLRFLSIASIQENLELSRSKIPELINLKLDHSLNVNDTLTEEKVESLAELQSDTIYEYDTVYVVGDTIRQTDTLIIIIPDTTKTNWSCELYFSTFYPQSIISANDVEFQEYSELLSEAHNSLISYTLGGNVNLIRKSWTLQTGISYTQFREKFTHQTFDYFYDTNIYIQIDTIESYYRVNGIDTTWIYVTEHNKKETIDSTKNYSNYNNTNKFSYFELPVILGYQFRKNKITYSIRAGAIIGLLIKNEGMTLSAYDNNEVMDINNSDLVKTNFAFVFGLGINYHIADWLGIFVEPFYRHNLGSIFRQDYPISQKSYSLGLKMGIKYFF